MTLTEIHQTLTKLGMSPSQSLGQNFLHDQNLARWIVDQAELEPGDHAIEIGPGLGALTEYIRETGVALTLIEKDMRLGEYLNERYGGERVQVHRADAVNFDTRMLFPQGPAKVIANLPYYVTTPVLFNFTSIASPAKQVFIMVQKEMGRRLSAQPGTPDYGRLTLGIQRRWRVKYLRTVPPTVFFPAPKIESALIRLDLRPQGEVPGCDARTFDRLVKLGFSQRRKQLKKMLKLEVDDWPALADALGISLTARAEELSLKKWIELTNRVAPGPPSTEDDAHAELFDVVDENDQVAGSEPRSYVHVNNLRHRAVHILVVNQHGEVFLQKRSHRKDRFPGHWDSSAAGHVSSGQGYDEAAVRETAEELGIEVPLTHVGKLAASEQTGQEFVQVYTAQHDGPFRIALDEIEFGVFFPPALIREWIGSRPQDFAPGFIECFRMVDALLTSNS